MPLVRSRLLIAALTLLVLLAASGCSRMRVAYNAADFFILREAADYLSLERTQKAAWTPTLQATLGRHRQDELPYLATFFDQLLAGARDGFTPAGLDCLLDQFEQLYQRNFRLAAEAAAPLLAALSPAQVDGLAQTFRQEAAEDAAGVGPEATATRLRKRAERYAENLDWWMGPLDSRQRGIVREITRRMPDTGPAWYRYRDAKREALIRLLREGADEQRIAAFLTAWVVDYQDLPAELGASRVALRQGFSGLLLELQPTLSTAQRDRFISRLSGLRDDFMALQPSPRKAPAGCRPS